MQPSTIERRIHSRVKATFPIKLKMRKPNPEMLSDEKGESIDISEGGIKIIKKGPLVSINTININMPPCYSEDPVKTQDIEAQVELKWSRPVKTANKFLYGFHFMKMKERDRNILRDIIHYKQEQALKKAICITRPKIDNNLQRTIEAIAKTGTKYITGSYLFTFGKFLGRLKKEPFL